MHLQAAEALEKIPRRLHARAHAHTNAHTCAHTHTHTHAYSHVQKYSHMHTYVPEHTHTHTYMHTHTLLLRGCKHTQLRPGQDKSPEALAAELDFPVGARLKRPGAMAANAARTQEVRCAGAKGWVPDCLDVCCVGVAVGVC